MTAPGEALGAAAGLAYDHLRASADAITEIQIALSEIAAPVGGEQHRADHVAQWLRSAGCLVSSDEVGNVIARRPSAIAGPAIVLSAHLDTVFPADQDVRVARPGRHSPYGDQPLVPPGQLHGPGIADDAAGLAAVIGIAQALAAAGLPTKREIILLATVGEEGRGDLRGARHFFAGRAAAEIGAFITIDHPDPAVIVHRGVGSLRYAVRFEGPGGHAWGNFGRYNPALAMAAAAERVGAIEPPGPVRSSFNVGLMTAGRAVNAIPESATMEVDLRSEDQDTLDRLDAAFRRAVQAGHDAELARRPSGTARLTLGRIGQRPAGETPPTSPLVAAARRALEAEGFAPRLAASSTDANAAMAAGVAAICLSWGGHSDNQHSLREQFAPAGRERTLGAILRLLIDLAGVD